LEALSDLTPMSTPMNRHSDQVLNDIAGRYFLVLGAAAADLWSELPQELQHRLFEQAVLLGHQGEQDESLREQLAKFLHDHHERTIAK
jgi:glucose-6-phosphate-specific signal transduction histidine kinase